MDKSNRVNNKQSEVEQQESKHNEVECENEILNTYRLNREIARQKF